MYLLTKNLKTRTPSKKLDYIKVGPFFIKQVKGPENYKLDLLLDVKVHPVFYILLLEPADPETPVQEIFNFETQEEDTFVVEKILRQEGQRYLIKWKGYPTSENTWEPREYLENCQRLLDQFYRRKPAIPRHQERRRRK